MEVDRIIDTIDGPIPESELLVKEVRTNGPNDIGLAREWYLGDKLVRREAWVTILRGQSISGEQGKI